MYLSRLMLNPRSRRVQKEIAEPYQMHRSLMQAFPGTLPQNERVLFRLETHPRNGWLALLVQSQNAPDWSWLAEPKARGYLLPDDLLPPDVKNLEAKPFDLTFVPGQALAFRLRANPTVKRRFNQTDHKRVGLYREEEQIDWLKRKGERGGFQVLSVRIGNQDHIMGNIYRGQAKHPLRLLVVQFDGLLQVTDPGRLLEGVRQGIGSGKGLGCGLLSLAPAT